MNIASKDGGESVVKLTVYRKTKIYLDTYFEHIRPHYHCLTYKVDHLAGADAVIQTHPALIIWIFSPCHYILITHVVGPFIYHPSPALHPDRVASA